MEWWAYVLTGGAAAAMIKIVDNVIQWRLSRKAKEDDEEQLSLQGLKDAIESLRAGQKVILHDRIKYLACTYMSDGEISFDDLNDLKEMHRIYRSLGGENLVRPMQDVESLKTKYHQ